MAVVRHQKANDPTHPHKTPTVLFKPKQQSDSKHSSKKHTNKVPGTKSP